MGCIDSHIQLKYLRIYRESKLLLQAEKLKFPEQAVTALVGPSGSGKTLTAYVMLDLLKLAAPSLWAKADIHFPARWSACRVSYVPQGTGLHLQPTVSIRSQMRNLVCGKRGLDPGLYSDGEAACLLKRLRINNPQEVLDLKPVELSGGMLQRILLTIAILRRPHFMVLDEPMTALDGYARAIAYKVILDCCTQYETTVLLLSHNPRDVSVLADHVMCIEDGVIVPGPDPESFRNKIPIADSCLNNKSVGSSIWSTDRLTVSLTPKHVRSTIPFLRKRTICNRFSIEPFSIKLRPSDCLGIVGESGCGKTTLLLAMACLIPNDSGGVMLGSTDLTTQSVRHLRRLRRYFQITFQDASKSLNPSCSVEDILCEPFLIHGETVPETRALRDALYRVHLPTDILARNITELSHGQRQRLAMLRVLTSFPHLKVLLVDEPFSGLDPIASHALIELLRDKAEERVTVIATHDIEWIQDICNHVHLMKNGEHVETCPGPKPRFRIEYARKFWQAGLVADRSSLIELSNLISDDV